MESGYERQIKSCKAIGRIVARRPACVLPVLLLSCVAFGAYSSTLPGFSERGAEQTLIGLPFDKAFHPNSKL